MLAKHGFSAKLKASPRCAVVVFSGDVEGSVPNMKFGAAPVQVVLETSPSVRPTLHAPSPVVLHRIPSVEGTVNREVHVDRTL